MNLLKFIDPPVTPRAVTIHCTCGKATIARKAYCTDCIEKMPYAVKLKQEMRDRDKALTRGKVTTSLLNDCQAVIMDREDQTASFQRIRRDLSKFGQTMPDELLWKVIRRLKREGKLVQVGERKGIKAQFQLVL